MATESGPRQKVLKSMALSMPRAPPALSLLIAQAMALRPFVPTPDAPLDMLSERELQIMILIVNCHKVQDVADQLCLSPKTVNTYRYRIFDKLGISSDVEMALVAVRHGMVDADEANPA